MFSQYLVRSVGNDDSNTTNRSAMTRIVLSRRLGRSSVRRLFSIMSFLCATLNPIEGFLSVSPKQISLRSACVFRRYRTLLRGRNVYRESRSVPRVVNPISRRQINLGGAKSTVVNRETILCRYSTNEIYQ